MCRPALARLLLLQLLLLKLHLGKGGVGAAPGGAHGSAGLPQGMGERVGGAAPVAPLAGVTEEGAGAVHARSRGMQRGRC